MIGYNAGMKLPRFSLRALFVLIAVLCIPLVWLLSERRFVQQRQQFLAKLPMNNSGNWINGDPYLTLSLPNARTSYLQNIPSLRRMLGDHICFSLLLPGNYDLAQIEEAITLFPEAAYIRRNDPERGSVDIKAFGVLLPCENY